MTMRSKAPKVLFLFLVFFTAAALGIFAFVDSQQIHSVLDKAFYLSAEDTVWIRPGLNLAIIDVKIPADRKPVVTFRITDGGGQALDRDGNLTPGRVSTSFILAYLPQNGSQYVDYSVRTQTSPITGVSATQAATDSGGRYTILGDGNYTYTFGTTLPSAYDTTATHTLGIYAARNLREWGLSLYVANVTKNFVPDGRQVTKIREVAVTSACNQCHNPLSAHGETGRRNVEICILCHTPQTPDPDTGNTTDMKVMTHKIHMGANLPSVKAGKPYQIIGFGQGVNDYSTVALPMDIRNCTSCHKDSKQVNAWLLNPTRDTCGSCHDNINWQSGANHVAGPQPDDKYCANCHWPESEYEYDATIKGAHTVPYESKQLRKPKLEIVSVANTGPGQKPTVQFKITDKNNRPIAPSTMGGAQGRLALTLAGPTSDYRWYIQEAANTANYADGVASYAFTGAIPATATGTYALEAEGYVNTTLNPGTTKELVYRDAIDNVVKYFAVTGTTVTPRRTVVDMARCNKCHDKLQLHGNNRNHISACILCHNPATTDTGQRPTAQRPPESIDMKIMAHRIHTGEELEGSYTVYGRGQVAHNYNEVRYPGDRRDCLQCHVPGAYTVPLPGTATSSTTPRAFWDPTRPTAAACLGCHDSVEAAAHAFINTATFGESCAVCHKESADFSVSKSHAR